MIRSLPPLALVKVLSRIVGPEETTIFGRFDESVDAVVVPPVSAPLGAERTANILPLFVRM